MKTKPIILPTHNPSGLFIQTNDMWGDFVCVKKLEYTENETLIRNNHLISNRRAATNALNKYEFFNIYLVSDDEIKEGDLMYNSNFKVVTIAANSTLVNCGGCYKIIASTDKALNLPFLDFCKESWIIDYYNKNGNLPDEIEVKERSLNIDEIREKGKGFLNTNNCVLDLDSNAVITKQPNDLKQKLFDLANEFAINKFGDIAVQLHSIHNTL